MVLSLLYVSLYLVSSKVSAHQVSDHLERPRRLVSSPHDIVSPSKRKRLGLHSEAEYIHDRNHLNHTERRI